MSFKKGKIPTIIHHIWFDFLTIFRSDSVSSNKGAVKKECSKTGYDEELLDLPDISHLLISDETEFMHIGSVSAIVSECGAYFHIVHY